MLVEVGSDSDNNCNLVHPSRKIIAVQEDFFLNIGCKCAEQTVCSSEKNNNLVSQQKEIDFPDSG